MASCGHLTFAEKTFPFLHLVSLAGATQVTVGKVECLVKRESKTNQHMRWDCIRESKMALECQAGITRLTLIHHGFASLYMDISLVRFCAFMNLDCVSAHKQVDQYPAILISHSAYNPYV